MNPTAELRPELKEKIQKWIASFYHLDPRYKILTFFNLVASEGADNIAQDNAEDDFYNLDRGSDSEASMRSRDDGGVYGKFNNPFLNRPSAANIRPSTAQLLANIFDATSILTVWRPCSNDAMRKMMEGAGVGKGLDIKGKSAKRGKLSAYVPFLQIHDNAHKTLIQPLTAAADMRIYYSSKKARDYVWEHLKEFLNQQKEGRKNSIGDKEETLVKDGGGGGGGDAENHDTGQPESATATATATAADSSTTASSDTAPSSPQSPSTSSSAPTRTSRVSFPEQAIQTMTPSRMKKIDKYQHRKWFGLEVSQRLFWNATIKNTNITRTATGTETGRPSTPGFQDANMKTLKVACAQTPKPSPMPVVLQTIGMDDDGIDENATHSDENDESSSSASSRTASADSNPLSKVLDPLHLVMAYEESGTVTPVVSDFDGFLLGWRREALWFGCNLPRDQEDLMLWCIDQIETILEEQQQSQTSDTWTCRWLDVLKRETHNGFHPEIPEYGFGDPKSYSIMEQAALRLKNTGAVRHGSECFNYYFPQEIDDVFLLVSDTLRPVPWRYVNVHELQAILSRKIAEGFVFPLNPKWILCDPGWKKLYDELMASEALYADLSKDVWYPPFSGVRERIDKIYKKHPNGFRPLEGAVCRRGSVAQANKTGYSPLRQNLNAGEKLSGNAAFDLAELELDDYVRHSVKHTLARQILEAHLEDLEELENEDDEDEEDGFEIKDGYSRDSGKLSAASSERSADSDLDGGCLSHRLAGSRIGPGGLLSQFSKRTLFRTQRQMQKKEELRYRSDRDDNNNLTENEHEDEEDPELAAAKAAVNGISITAEDASVVNSDTGSLHFAHQGVSARSNSSTSSQKSHRSTNSAGSDPRSMFASHMTSSEYPRRNFSEVLDEETSSEGLGEK